MSLTALPQGYTVTPGWVSSQDFLLGYALLSALPGPNFNFAVFLGTLSQVLHCSTSILATDFGTKGFLKRQFSAPCSRIWAFSLPGSS